MSSQPGEDGGMGKRPAAGSDDAAGYAPQFKKSGATIAKRAKDGMPPAGSTEAGELSVRSDEARAFKASTRKPAASAQTALLGEYRRTGENEPASADGLAVEEGLDSRPFVPARRFGKQPALAAEVTGFTSASRDFLAAGSTALGPTGTASAVTPGVSAKATAGAALGPTGAASVASSGVLAKAAGTAVLGPTGVASAASSGDSAKAAGARKRVRFVNASSPIAVSGTATAVGGEVVVTPTSATTALNLNPAASARPNPSFFSTTSPSAAASTTSSILRRPHEEAFLDEHGQEGSRKRPRRSSDEEPEAELPQSAEGEVDGVAEEPARRSAGSEAGSRSAGVQAGELDVAAAAARGRTGETVPMTPRILIPTGRLQKIRRDATAAEKSSLDDVVAREYLQLPLPTMNVQITQATRGKKRKRTRQVTLEQPRFTLADLGEGFDSEEEDGYSFVKQVETGGVKIKLPAQTKSGRKVNKPIPYQPAANGEPAAKKQRTGTGTSSARAAAVDEEMCKLCQRLNSPAHNPIVFCDGCDEGFHKQCHQPAIADTFIANPDMQWWCADCQRKRTAHHDARKKAVEPQLEAVLQQAETNEERQKRNYLRSLPRDQLEDLVMELNVLYPNAPIYEAQRNRRLKELIFARSRAGGRVLTAQQVELDHEAVAARAREAAEEQERRRQRELDRQHELELLREDAELQESEARQREIERQQRRRDESGADPPWLVRAKTARAAGVGAATPTLSHRISNVEAIRAQRASLSRLASDLSRVPVLAGPSSLSHGPGAALSTTHQASTVPSSDAGSSVGPLPAGASSSLAAPDVMAPPPRPARASDAGSVGALAQIPEGLNSPRQAAPSAQDARQSPAPSSSSDPSSAPALPSTTAGPGMSPPRIAESDHEYDYRLMERGFGWRGADQVAGDFAAAAAAPDDQEDRLFGGNGPVYNSRVNNNLYNNNVGNNLYNSNEDDDDMLENVSSVTAANAAIAAAPRTATPAAAPSATSSRSLRSRTRPGQFRSAYAILGDDVEVLDEIVVAQPQSPTPPPPSGAQAGVSALASPQIPPPRAREEEEILAAPAPAADPTAVVIDTDDDGSDSDAPSAAGSRDKGKGKGKAVAAAKQAPKATARAKGNAAATAPPTRRSARLGSARPQGGGQDQDNPWVEGGL